MKAVLVAPAPQSHKDDFDLTKNDVSQSIVNSITNDEDDSDGPRKNSEHSIVNSVTNDEDDWIESRTTSNGAAISILPRPSNYRSAFLTSSRKTNRYMDQKGDLMVKEQKKAAESSLSIFDLRSSPERAFNQQSFLSRYEQMMNRQEIEHSSTLSHIQSLLAVFEEIQFPEHYNENKSHQEFDGSNKLLKEFSFDELKQIREKLKNLDEYDIIKIDKQFLMVLDVLCEEKGDCPTMANNAEKQEKISGAEIIQCYRNCVLGMQTLEIIGPHAIIRKRAKERILATLSLYRKSSFAEYKNQMPMPSRDSNVAFSKTMSDDHAAISPKECQPRYQGNKPSSSLSHTFGSFVVGMMVASFILYGNSPTRDVMVAHQETSQLNITENIKCPVIVSESVSSEGEQSETQITENTIELSRDNLVPFMNEVSTLKKETPHFSINGGVAPSAGARTANGIALLPSDFSQKVRDFDHEMESKAEGNDDDHNQKHTIIPSNNLKVASIAGGAATAFYVLSSTSAPVTATFSWLPMGMTVLIATLAAHGIRDGISSIWRNLRRKKKKKRSNVLA